MDTKDELNIRSKSWVVKVILCYFSMLCLIAAYLLSLHIGTILTEFKFSTVGAAFFLIIYSYILIINVNFLIRKKYGTYDLVLTSNIIFGYFSGLGLMLQTLIIANNFGADLSLALFHSTQGTRISYYYNLFNLAAEWKLDPNNYVYGVRINLIMWLVSSLLLMAKLKHKSIIGLIKSSRSQQGLPTETRSSPKF